MLPNGMRVMTRIVCVTPSSGTVCRGGARLSLLRLRPPLKRLPSLVRRGENTGGGDSVKGAERSVADLIEYPEVLASRRTNEGRCGPRGEDEEGIAVRPPSCGSAESGLGFQSNVDQR